MSKISTKELFDLFFDGKDESVVKKIRPQVDRPEVYAFEEKIGKSLVDMSVEELFQMILSFNNNRKSDSANYSVSYASYDQMASLYRAIFDYYINNIEVIINPWNNKQMRGVNASKRLAQDKAPFTYSIVENVIQKIYDEYEEGRAKNLECIIQLFYNGFSKAEEIATLKEDMINFSTNEIALQGRTITVSDHCMELLVYVHNMDSMIGWRGDYAMTAWHDGYYKLAIRPKEVDTINDRSLYEVASFINRLLLVHVRKKFDVDINYRLLYLLGFYDMMVKKVGKERTDEIITSIRVSDDVVDLTNFARCYGVFTDSISHLKRCLRPFVG